MAGCRSDVRSTTKQDPWPLRLAAVQAGSFSTKQPAQRLAVHHGAGRPGQNTLEHRLAPTRCRDRLTGHQATRRQRLVGICMAASKRLAQSCRDVRPHGFSHPWERNDRPRSVRPGRHDLHARSAPPVPRPRMMQTRWGARTIQGDAPPGCGLHASGPRSPKESTRILP